MVTRETRGRPELSGRPSPRRGNTTAEILVTIGLVACLFFFLGLELVRVWSLYTSYAAALYGEGLP